MISVRSLVEKSGVEWVDDVMQVIYVVVRMLIFHSTFTWKNWVALLLTSVAYYIPYQQLAQMAKPTYADNGELLDGGFDMTTGGVCGYVLTISDFLTTEKIFVYCSFLFLFFFFFSCLQRMLHPRIRISEAYYIISIFLLPMC